MYLNGFLNELDDFSSGLTNAYTSWEVWNVCTKTLWTLFDDNGVLRRLILLQTGLFLDIFERAGWHIHAELT